MSKIDTVIFDIGNVISRWDIRFLYEKLIDDPQELEWFLNHVVTPEWHFQHDAGRPFIETSRELIAQFPDHADLISLFQSRFNETNPGEVAGVAELIQQLHGADIPLFGISNFSAEFWPHFRKGKPVFDHFQDIVISGEENLVKPDAAIYELALNRFGVSAKQCLFVDDRLDNIEGAEALGIKGHHFQDAALLEAELKALSLL
ncbi:HAD family phosphatase [Parasphingorhabdus cellanae]|uniref:HAD family phosphatase n=1 Tax=Parasphingorhabdus cellanae TaxID=2806553 RepID=A0ABX7TAQ6_9SPHN|nr:HAD family phosphatase [Parasphingorhabdus cellanae]